MSKEDQPTPTNIIGSERFEFARKKQVVRAAYARARDQAVSGQCSKEIAHLFASAPTFIDQMMALSLLMTEQEMDVWSDLIETDPKYVTPVL